ncbi:outer membrane insertion signal domain protein [Pyramidobacter piscolens W5455]|uniref:Outer membrane insertion signal domain protein n=1 Tax=Pyramidobacter piscolens W5455 TaxID=352165 RepID=A0ABM9ZXU1_9BACT|nr:outer membrane protein transport protein [Pyramidobacter piscolens]EFB91728.1 outer membrane insertion signal domain protein [Pyramidobacter piscolens W5455]
MNMRKTAALALSAALLAAPAYADGFAVYEWSARGVGMGGAMMFGDEASLIAYNPAAITQFDEKGTFSGAVTYIAPRGYADFLDGSDNVFLTQHNKNNPAYVPAMFYARRIQPNAWFGVGVYPRFGLKASYDPGWYGRFSNRSIEFLSVSFAPNVAWKIAPSLSMSAGAELMYAGLKLDKSTRLGGETPIDLDGDSWGVGWNVGLNWQATPRLSLAALYRSEVKQTVEGDVNLYSGMLGTISTRGKGAIHLPESYTFGVGYRFSDRTRVEFNAIKTMWSSYKDLTIDVAVPQPYQAMFGGLTAYPYNEPKNWRDGWRYQFGVEHKINDKWTIRAGFVYDDCSSRDPDNADFMVPTGTRRTYTFGASCRVKNVEYSFGYGYMDVGDKRINRSGEKLEDASTRGCDAHIISIGARIDL